MNAIVPSELEPDTEDGQNITPRLTVDQILTAFETIAVDGLLCSERQAE
jgi:hypothetical protein